MDLQDPTSKMSKSSVSESGVVHLLEDADSIARKFKRAVTDNDGEVRADRETKPGVTNLLEILSAVRHEPVDVLARSYSGYGQLKSDVADAVIAELTPIRRRYEELTADPAELTRLISIGNDRARAVAAATLGRAERAVGLMPRV